MKQLFTFAFIILTGLKGTAQIQFEEGYFIDNFGKKTEALIENEDWYNSPESFNYKTSQNSEIKTLTISEVKKFKVGHFLFERAQVKIDRSPDQAWNLSHNRRPNFVVETLFLKILIDGKADLLWYKDEMLQRYFYRIGNSEIEQLIHKNYLILHSANHDRIAHNNRFRQQLWTDLKCEGIELSDIEKIAYSEDDLEKFFIKYNTCQNTDFINYEAEQPQGSFNFIIKAGANLSSVHVERGLRVKNGYTGNDWSFTAGVEGEYILPFNKKKWSVFIGSSYNSFNPVIESSPLYPQFWQGTLIIDYKFIEFALGLRHYLFLNESSKLFIHSALVKAFAFKYQEIFVNTGDVSDPKISEFKISPYLKFGIGFKYLNKYSIGVNYESNALFESPDNIRFISKISTLSVVFGYTIF